MSFGIATAVPRSIGITKPRRYRQGWLLVANELLDAFEQLTKKQVWPAKFALLIGGVDEHMGDPAEIAPLLKAFATSTDVKLVVASRPWTEIELYLNTIPGQSLILQDYTRKDIKQYAHDLISNHPGFRNAYIHEKYNQLNYFIDLISHKSQGVFLWVALAVQEILKGLTHEDAISELKARLEDIPPGLEELFERILNSVERCYRSETSQILQMCLVARTPLPLLAFAFLGREQHDPDYAIHEELHPWSLSRYKKEQATIKKRVKARCRDFLNFTYSVQLDVPPRPAAIRLDEWKVDFLHRTVKDFFLKPSLKVLLLDWLKHPYNPQLSLCLSFAMQMKILPVLKPEPGSQNKHIDQSIHSSMYHAKGVDTSCDPTVWVVIEEIERIAELRDSLRGNQCRIVSVMSVRTRLAAGLDCGHRCYVLDPWICSAETSRKSSVSK